MTPQALLPTLFLPLILFGFYRRFRRNFGRQPIQTKRMIFRITLLSVIGAVIVALSWHRVDALAGVAGGLVVGVALAVVGLRLTRFESSPEGTFYLPNTYIGVAISLVLIARLLYRYLVTNPIAQATSQQAAAANPFATIQGSPLTLAILAVVIGYYVTYFSGVLRKARCHDAASASK